MFRRRSKTRPIVPEASLDADAEILELQDVEIISVPEWPQGIPRLYPNLSDKELSEFLPDELYRKALAFPRVMVLPFGSANGSVREQLVGMGLSRLLIRDLMLLRNLSIRGPEDTPNDFPKDPLRPSKRDRSDISITGLMTMEDFQRFSARLWIHRQDDPPVEISIPAAECHPLIANCRSEIVRALDGVVNAKVEAGWQTGRPGSFELLQDFGQLCLAKEDSAQTQQAIALWKSHPDFVLPLHLSNEGVGHLLRGMEYDPHDAQLFFLLFLGFWESTGPQPEAVQFLRRAISLSPGHGKAHMCAPHAADPQVDMLRHSELGYRLLPGNPFAINNYIIYLQAAGKTEDLKRLAIEGIETDPYDHGSYDRLIELYEAEGNFEEALYYARQLAKLYGPPIHPRTYVCLQQNPQRAAYLKAGWDPADDVKGIIHRLNRLAAGENVQIVALTPRAAKELERFIRRARMPRDTRIRVTAHEDRDERIRYQLDFDHEFDRKLDEEFECLGIQLVVERAQIPFLDGTLVDYQPRRGDDGRFVFDNPNEG